MTFKQNILCVFLPYANIVFFNFFISDYIEQYYNRTTHFNNVHQRTKF